MEQINLTQGAVLQGGKYKIQKVLGQGGFGVTYLAEQTTLHRKTAVKEFFMKDLCNRDGETSAVSVGSAGSKELVERFRKKFLKEARMLSRLNHPNIVHVIDVFEENGTAYYVMEYAEGGSLNDKLKKLSRFTEPLATRYILEVAEALAYIHQRKMNHLDVKPGNIMLTVDDHAMLIDFGLSKQYDERTGGQTSTTPVGISEGYAPMEQYTQGGVKEFSPETDVYALGATFYKLLAGNTPPSASAIYEDGVPVQELRNRGVSEKAIAAICRAMEPRRRERMSSARQFIDALTAEALDSTQTDEATRIFPNANQPAGGTPQPSAPYQHPVGGNQQAAGADYSRAGADYSAAGGEAPQSADGEEEPRRGLSMAKLGIIGAVLGIVIIGVCIYAFSGKKSNVVDRAALESAIAQTTDTIATDTEPEVAPEVPAAPTEVYENKPGFYYVWSSKETYQDALSDCQMRTCMMGLAVYECVAKGRKAFRVASGPYSTRDALEQDLYNLYGDTNVGGWVWNCKGEGRCVYEDGGI